MPDLINGAFESLAGLMVLNHCRVLYAHKETRGVSVASTGFFVSWGFWNLYYYPSLRQPMSFYGGLVVVCANALYLGMMVVYRTRAPRVFPQGRVSIALPDCLKRDHGQ
ncbi:MAG: hypothetical protein M0T84_15600 [Betaproteobacteria bacterium]|nr:hypothetical protein [Betaproteobacteria bacterium]